MFQEKKFIVNFNRKSYDIKPFISKHPGGVQTLQNLGNSAIDDKLKKYHHSEAAMNLFEQYRMEKTTMNDDLENLVDWNSGMLTQLHKLGDRYHEWVNLPLDRVVKMFDNELLEFFSKTPWYGILLFWIPIMCGIVHNEHSDMNTSKMFLNFITGIFLWTIIEYLLHRYVFHMSVDGKGSKWTIFHFLIHGIHHKTPFDGMRLVFPPVAGVIVAIILYNIVILPLVIVLGDPFSSRVILSGSIFGYLFYDLTHYYLHYGNPSSEYFYHLKRYHYNHHFVNHDSGFGISSIFWDNLFGTEIALKKLSFRLKW